jgi:hypothetical protein
MEGRDARGGKEGVMDEQLRENAQKMLRVLDEGGIDVIREMGIKGERSDDTACLVALYLDQTVGGVWSVGCESATPIVNGRGTDDLPLPAGVQTLIDNFDDGHYPDLDDGTMPECRKELEEAVVGHRIVSVEKLAPGDWYGEQRGAIITLDNGKRVKMRGTDDCCAYTEVKEFLLHPERVDHIITGVGTTDGYNTWHIYADMGDVLELKVGWSPGNIVVEDVE